MRGPPGAVLCVFLLGCGYPEYRYLDERPVPDVSVPEADGEPLADACVANGCGSCNDRGVKGLRCEPCGQWTCAGSTVVCTPASPAPNTTCGLCGTQRVTCTALGTTTCPMEDDRLVYEDAAFKSKDDKQWVVDRANEALVAFKSVRALTYSDVSVVLRRIPYTCAFTTALPHPDPACNSCLAASGGYNCSVSPPLPPGEVTLTLYAGSPSTGLTPLATASVAATSVSDGSAAFVVGALSTAVSPRPVGTPLAIGITTASTAYAFEVYGGGAASFPAAAADTVFWHRVTKPSAAWIEEPTRDLAHVLRGKACAP